MVNPINMKARIREALSVRFFLKHRITCPQWSFSSAYSSRVTRLCFDPSGRIPAGTSTYSFPLVSSVSQVTCNCSASVTTKLTLEAMWAVPTKVFTLILGDGSSEFSPLVNRLLALTGGSVVTPTPLPSATNDTQAARGSSGAPLRPWTQRYAIPLVGQDISAL